MAGVLPIDVAMDAKHLRSATSRSGRAGRAVLGEARQRVARPGVPPVADRAKRRLEPSLFDVTTSDGDAQHRRLRAANVVASYVHLHFSSNRDARDALCVRAATPATPTTVGNRRPRGSNNAPSPPGGARRPDRMSAGARASAANALASTGEGRDRPVRADRGRRRGQPRQDWSRSRERRRSTGPRSSSSRRWRPAATRSSAGPRSPRSPRRCPAPAPPPWVRSLTQYDAYIAFGMPQYVPSRNLYYNVAVLLGPDGERRRHLQKAQQPARGLLQREGRRARCRRSTRPTGGSRS